MTTIPCRRIAAALQEALTEFYNEQVKLIRDVMKNSYIENVRIVLIEKKEQIPIFKKFATPQTGKIFTA